MNGVFFKNPNLYEENQNLKMTELNILKDNIGRKLKVFIYFNDDEKFISGILENYQNYLLIISDPNNGNWYLIPQQNLSYIEFEEKINF
ncbi:MAG: spore coat protein GerQ [Bacilli bacterium]|nr:spore coat protein GerQ [Bacilli bacterium]